MGTECGNAEVLERAGQVPLREFGRLAWCKTATVVPLEGDALSVGKPEWEEQERCRVYLTAVTVENGTRA